MGAKKQELEIHTKIDWTCTYNVERKPLTTLLYFLNNFGKNWLKSWREYSPGHIDTARSHCSYCLHSSPEGNTTLVWAFPFCTSLTSTGPSLFYFLCFHFCQEMGTSHSEVSVTMIMCVCSTVNTSTFLKIRTSGFYVLHNAWLLPVEQRHLQ